MVPLSEALAHALAPRLGHGPEHPVLYPYRHASSISQAFRRLAKRLGIRGVSVHSLRHGALTRMLKNGADLHTVMQIAGHKNLSTTQIYLHTLETERRKAVSTLTLS